MDQYDITLLLMMASIEKPLFKNMFLCISKWIRLFETVFNEIKGIFNILPAVLSVHEIRNMH